MGTNVIIVIVGVIALFIIIKFIAKTIFKLVLAAIIIAALALFLFLKVGNSSKEINYGEIVMSYSIADLENAYCDSGNKSDSLKCVCIIKPISDDLHSTYNSEELDDLQKHRIKFAAAIVKAFNNKKEVIKLKLKENNADKLFLDFKNDLSDGKIFSKIERNKELNENQN